jgi:hypothetical protein
MSISAQCIKTFFLAIRQQLYVNYMVVQLDVTKKYIELWCLF